MQLLNQYPEGFTFFSAPFYKISSYLYYGPFWFRRLWCPTSKGGKVQVLFRTLTTCYWNDLVPDSTGLHPIWQDRFNR